MPNIHQILGQNIPSPVQEIEEEKFHDKGIQLFIKRDDLIHSEVSGNKWRKLKYNLLEVQGQNQKTVLTFGGAYSNHIAATAAACKLAGFRSIGIIRGEELTAESNHTSRLAAKNGMHLEFISRSDYLKKSETEFLKKLKKKFGDFFLVPEGGANNSGAEGCKEIVQELEEEYDYICLACGTGTTMVGIISAAKPAQKILGFPVLKGGEFLEDEILKQAEGGTNVDWKLKTNYHFGGYAKYNHELLEFIRDFKARHQIELDFIYTGKMMFGIYDLMGKGYFPKGSKVLAIHTGGLQGNQGLHQQAPVNK